MVDKLNCLILGAGSAQLPMFKAAVELGLGIVAFDGNPEAVGKDHADHFECVDIKYAMLVVEAAKQWNKKVGIDGVISAAVECGPAVGAVVDYFGFPGIGYDTALKLTDKSLRNKELEKMGIAHPQSSVITDTTRPPKWGIFPCVTKPANESAAVGVVLKNNAAELATAPAGHIIQEYIEGWEISAEIIIGKDGKHSIFLADRNYNKKHKWPPYMLEDGFQTPSKIPDKIKRKIDLVAERVISYFNLRSCAIKLDLIIKDNVVYVLEIAPRLGGGKLSSVGVPLSTGYDWWGAALKMAMGDWLPLPQLLSHTYVAQRWIFPEHPTSHKSRLRDYIAVGGSYEEAIAKAEAMVANDRNP